MMHTAPGTPEKSRGARAYSAAVPFPDITNYVAY